MISKRHNYPIEMGEVVDYFEMATQEGGEYGDLPLSVREDYGHFPDEIRGNLGKYARKILTDKRLEGRTGLNLWFTIVDLAYNILDEIEQEKIMSIERKTR